MIGVEWWTGMGPPPPGRGARAGVHVEEPLAGDHPRLGGEHRSESTRPASDQGPPPPGRGAPLTRPTDDRPRGTTPAWAGSTGHVTTREETRRDHPRLGGEHGARNPGSVPSAGPPPPGRGALARRPAVHHRTGTTPAWAGSTGGRCGLRHGRRDHPRLGGEHSNASCFSASCQGPPPPGRGARVRESRGGRCGGTTPAWAGSTLSDLQVCTQSVSTITELSVQPSWSSSCQRGCGRAWMV